MNNDAGENMQNLQPQNWSRVKANLICSSLCLYWSRLIIQSVGKCFRWLNVPATLMGHSQKKKKKSNFPLLIITQLKVIWLSGDVICRGLDVPDSTWEKKWSVWWGWSRQDGTAMWCDPEDSERAGRRALSQYFFKTMDPDPFTGMTVYSFLFQQRKADKHYTGLGGCSSWQRPEQSRWSQQVRWAKNAFFFSFLYSVFSLHSASCASQSAVMFSIFLLCSKCFYSIHQPQKASVVRRYNGNVNLDASDP